MALLKKEIAQAAMPVTVLTPNALTVLQKRYLKKDLTGNVSEKSEDLFWRVAQNISQADKNYDPKADTEETAKEFYASMSAMDFLPNSPTLMNAGRALQQLSACFVLPIEDSMESIFETLKNTALIHKSGGGTGFSFSRLRPSSDIVKSTRGVSSGPVSFMYVFNAATEAIKQGGTRRGANMGILRVDHPDIMSFIVCKDQDKTLNNFNISVAITEEFMQALNAGIDYNLYNPRSGEKTGTLSAKDVFAKIVEQAWKNGEPGIVFIDKMNDANPTPAIGTIESTNPCGEQPLLPYESCNLGSINLAHFVKDNEVDWERLGKTVISAVHFLDNVIDMNNFPLKRIDDMTRSNRKIGLGVMGWADMLIQLGIPYNSKVAFALGEKLMGFVQKKAEDASEKLAQKRGNFPNYEKSIFAGKVARRNATLTTLAPTGTIGIIANASGGVEPIFAIVYKRANVLDNNELFEVNPYFEKIAKEMGFYSTELINKISEKGSIKDFNEIPESVRKVFTTSHDILPEDHVKMQAAFQKHTDNAVSKTVNFSHSATKEDVAEVYMLAYKLGCKGVTVYRDGSRDAQVLNLAKSENHDKSNEFLERRPRERPKVTHGFTLRMQTGCGKMYVTINEDASGPCEIFTALGKSGGCLNSQTEALSRLVSLNLRLGVNMDEVISQLKSIRCPAPVMTEGGVVLSCADAVAKALETYKKEKLTPNLFSGDVIAQPTDSVVQDLHSVSNNKTGIKKNSIGSCPECPECGEMLEFGEGCAVCHACGYSKCW